MRKILLTVVALTALSFPTSASADWLTDSLRIAESYWVERGFSQCAGLPIEIEWRETNSGAVTGSCAVIAECRIGIRNCYPDGVETQPLIGLETQTLQRSWRKRCRLVIHEYGHLVGLKHWESQFQVMNEYRVPRVCIRIQSKRMKGGQR